MYGLGWVSKVIGLSWMLPPDKRDDTFGLGVIVFVCIIVALLFCLVVYTVGSKLIEIWKKS